MPELKNVRTAWVGVETICSTRRLAEHPTPKSITGTSASRDVTLTAPPSERRLTSAWSSRTRCDSFPSCDRIKKTQEANRKN